MSEFNESRENATVDDEPAERWAALAGLDEWLETPLRILGLIWLALLIVELAYGLTPLLTVTTTAIWVVFIVDFSLRVMLAPQRWRYVRNNWLTALSLIIPALRVFRVVRAVRLLRVAGVTRGVRLVRVVASMNRGMRSLGRLMERRGLGYVVALTVLVTLLGAAGMYTFERDVTNANAITSYSTALWWTAMVMTTMGTEYWPRTAEGRALCLLLAIYAFTMFGYVTASLASFFIGQDAERQRQP